MTSGASAFEDRADDAPSRLLPSSRAARTSIALRARAQPQASPADSDEPRERRANPVSRAPVDPFSFGDISAPGTRACAEALDLIQKMEVVFTNDEAGVHLYRAKLCFVPVDDLRRLYEREVAMIFSTTFTGGLDNDWANRRRRRPLSSEEHARWSSWDLDGTLAAHDPATNAVIYPMAPLSRHAYRRLDVEVPGLHEIGHALTQPDAEVRAPLRGDLVEGLRGPIATHVAQYAKGDEPQAVRERVLEALAEAYRLLTLERPNDIPQPLLSALLSILRGDGLPIHP
jgi:hypothetical protein